MLNLNSIAINAQEIDRDFILTGCLYIQKLLEALKRNKLS